MFFFQTKIYKELYWVPLTSLGQPSISNNSFNEIMDYLPEEKRNYIHTLVDAVNLFVASEFEESQDVVCLLEKDGTLWEHHKPGYYSVLSNKGCCSSCASWLNYMLAGRYEDIGLIIYMRPNGNGHCINYIYHDEWYYFIDMSLRIKKYSETIAKETGNILDYIRSRPFANILLKSKTIDLYIEYISKYEKIGNRKFMFSVCKDMCAPPISLTKHKNILHVLYPITSNINVLNKQELDGIYTCKFVDAPLNIPNWQELINK